MPEFDSRTAMAISKTTTKRSPQASATDLKQKTISCLNKLSDRDTFKIASSELETIAQTLTPDSFSPFLACIYDTDSSHKSPVRKQCVRLFQTLALAHEDALSPFVPKILQNILRRLRDPDSAVRSACVETISAVAARVTKPPFSVFLRPFTEAILTEQDCNSQNGAAMCLSAAIDSAPDVDPAQLQRILPKFMKLLRCESFRAKPALISLIGSVAGVGGAKSGSLLGVLVPYLVEFLSSEDWAARKAASDALLKVAVAERDLVGEFKDSCLVAFESRQYDKVKSVRDSMKQMIVAWKEVPDVSCNGVSLPEQSKSSSAENASDGHFPNASKTSSTLRSDSPLKGRKRLPISRFSPLGNEQKSCPPLFRKLDRKKSPNWKIEVAIPRDSPYTVNREENAENGKGGDGKVLDQKDNKVQARSDVKRSLFDKNGEEKTSRFGRLRSQARVAPYHEKESSESTVVVSNVVADSCESHKDGGDDLSLIRKQLVQIENQQSSLLDLLQKFIGSSQNGMRSLETRVHSLELALDEISHDLALSTTRMTNSNTAVNSCCKLPGAEFLSSKFWRRTETERYSNSRFSTSGATPLVDESYKLESRSYRPHGAFVVNPLAEMHSQSRGNSEISLNRPLMSGINHQSGVRQAYVSNRFLEVSPVS